MAALYISVFCGDRPVADISPFHPWCAAYDEADEDEAATATAAARRPSRVSAAQKQIDTAALVYPLPSSGYVTVVMRTAM